MRDTHWKMSVMVAGCALALVVVPGARAQTNLLVTTNLIVLDGGGAGFTGEEIRSRIEGVGGGATGGGTGMIATDGAEDIEEAVNVIQPW